MSEQPANAWSVLTAALLTAQTTELLSELTTDAFCSDSPGKAALAKLVGPTWLADGLAELAGLSRLAGVAGSGCWGAV